jgi:hypothetical protein
MDSSNDHIRSIHFATTISLGWRDQDKDEREPERRNSLREKVKCTLSSLFRMMIMMSEHHHHHELRERGNRCVKVKLRRENQSYSPFVLSSPLVVTCSFQERREIHSKGRLFSAFSQPLDDVLASLSFIQSAHHSLLLGKSLSLSPTI